MSVSVSVSASVSVSVAVAVAATVYLCKAVSVIDYAGVGTCAWFEGRDAGQSLAWRPKTTMAH